MLNLAPGTDPLTLIDGYKIDHRRQYPPGTTKVYSNWTPRGSRVPGATGVIFFGLRYFLRRYLDQVWHEGFFGLGRASVLSRYERRLKTYLGPNSITLEHIDKLYSLRYLPLELRALCEGTFVPLRVPALTIENTDPDHAWLVNYTETLLSNAMWKACTSATTAMRYRQLLMNGARTTGGDLDFVGWQGHDFSFRGMSGVEDAMLSGAGHLIFFDGTDSIPAIEFVEHYYNASGVGGSVAATEHSVMCAGGEERERDTFLRLITEVYPSGIVSIVSDTWDLWRVLTVYLPSLKEDIMARDGKVVIRPDSGDPVKIICGDPQSTDPRAVAGVVELLWRTFGGTINEAGYKVLDPHIGAIYGDSINEERMRSIIEGLRRKGFASSNVVFGIGSYSYEYVTRDTYGFAMKATSTDGPNGRVALFKSPVTDSGEKHSARGRLAVIPGDFGQPCLVENATPELEEYSMLQPVYHNGLHINPARNDFSRIRTRARAYSDALSIPAEESK